MELASQRVYAFKIFIDENFILSNYLSKSLSQFIFFLSLCIFKDFWSYCAAYRVLFPQLGFEPVPTVVETWNPNYCTATEVPSFLNELPFQLGFMLLSCIFHFLLNRDEEARKELWGQSFFLARSVVFLPILTPTHIYVRPSKT